jgi:Uma2 family endonuclease
MALATAVNPQEWSSSATPPRPWRLTRARYHQLGELGVFEGRRVQLLYGTVFDMSPMGTPHSMAIRVLTRALTSATLDQALDVMVQLPLAAADDSEPEPDFAILPTLTQELEDHPATALLVIEVADSSLKLDLGPKATLYAACRIPEYWVIDLQGGTTVVHRRPARSGYSTVRRIPWSRELRSSAVPAVKLTLASLLRRARP